VPLVAITNPMKRAILFLNLKRTSKEYLLCGRPVLYAPLEKIIENYKIEGRNQYLSARYMIRIAESRQGKNYKLEKIKWAYFPLEPKENPNTFSSLFTLVTSDYVDRERKLNLSLTESRIRKFDDYYKKITESKSLFFSIDRWGSSLNRGNSLDATLDCCASIEALFGIRDEIRLRISLLSQLFSSTRKRETFSTVYEMYGVRSKYVHGNDFPEVSKEKLTSYIKTTAHVLESVLSMKKALNSQQYNDALINKFGI